jgi:hypothetical protein
VSGAVRVEVLTFEGCPNGAPAVELVERLVAETGVEAEVAVVQVETDEQARAHRFLGSPTVQVDGRDIEPGSEERTDYSMSCRVYRTESGFAGLPPAEHVVAALTASR